MLVGAAVGIGAALLVMNDDESAEPPATASGADTGEIGTPGCDYEDTSGCVPGAELVVNDGEWLCDEPLAKYARSLGGELPLKVTARFTQPVETVAGVVDLTSGCRGDGTKAIDLILDIQGDGRTFGGTGDALAVKIKATNIDITGSINCGPRGPRRPPGRDPGPRRQRHRVRRPRGWELGEAAVDLHGRLGRHRHLGRRRRRHRPEELQVHPLPRRGL